MILRETLHKIKQELDTIDKIGKDSLDLGLDIKMHRVENLYTESIRQNCKYILSRSNYKAMMVIDRYYKKENRDDKDNYGFIEII